MQQQNIMQQWHRQAKYVKYAQETKRTFYFQLYFEESNTFKQHFVSFIFSFYWLYDCS